VSIRAFAPVPPGTKALFSSKQPFAIGHLTFLIFHLKKRSLVLEGSKLGLLLRGNHKDDKTKGQRPLLKMENEKWKMINDK
jgi:hypothetical protein